MKIKKILHSHKKESHELRNLDIPVLLCSIWGPAVPTEMPHETVSLRSGHCGGGGLTGSPSTRGARGLCLALRPTNSCVCGPVSHPRPREADCPPRSGRDPGTLGLPPPHALSGLQQKSGQGPFLFQLSEGFVWLSRAIGSSSLCPSGSPSGSPGRHGQRRLALTGHARSRPPRRCSLRRGTIASPRFSFWRPERTDAGGVTSRRSQGNERGRQGQNPPAAGPLIGLRVRPILGFAMWLWTSDIRPSPAAASPPFPRPGL